MPTAADRIFPAFIVAQMPTGIAGLLVAAILAAAMSNLSAALNSLSSTTVVDFYLRLRPAATDRQRNRFSRGSTLVWALVLFAIAAYSVARGGHGHVVETGLAIASVAYGSLLGVFLLGTLTRYATEAGAIVGMILGFALNLALWLQGHAIRLPGGFILPRVAYTWYVVIGSVVTFAAGSLASITLPRKRALTSLLVLFGAFGMARALHAQAAPPPYDFGPLNQVLEDAIQANQIPGAVLAIGHGGTVVHHRAFGNRAVEPAIEPATEDTVYDMASLSKCLSTAVAVMQLYEAGRLGFDDPVSRYLPAFAANAKGSITIRELLTHYSGLREDVTLTDVWSSKGEGIRRALDSVPYGPPGLTFRYSDINFITLGALVEKLSGESLDVYAGKHIFAPLGMIHTRYTPPASLTPEIAPTNHNDDKPMTHDELLRGVVHDPTTRRMGGVAGHAGVFSTLGDTELFAQALLDRLAGRPSAFPLRTDTLRLMCQPEQPPSGKALRGFGWDIDSPFSRPRGEIFPIGSFGHTGYTGTSLWIDPRSGSYVILLTNALHPRGRPPITALRGRVATEAARAFHLDTLVTPVQTGIDMLQSTHFAALQQLKPHPGQGIRIGLLTNGTGLDSKGRRTVDILHTELPKAVPGARLVTLFSPEHGIAGTEDREGIAGSTDAATGLPVVSLYGSKPEDRRPRLSDLEKLDAVVIDLQDAGVRFYTYETVLGYFLEAAAKAVNKPAVLVLDRPALISAVTVNGPTSDPGTESYISYMPEPSQHGMTLGELARFINGEHHLGANLAVVPVQGYQRGLPFEATGLPWVNPSPNLRSLAAATLYPGLAFLEFTNVSVGRGTDRPFEQMGAAWIGTSAEAEKLAAALTARKLSGVEIAATRFTPSAPYPFADHEIHGLAFHVTDRQRFDAAEFGIELMAALHTQYPQAFQMGKAKTLILNQATLDALSSGKDPHEIAAAWEADLGRFRSQRARYLLYGFLPELPAVSPSSAQNAHPATASNP